MRSLLECSRETRREAHDALEVAQRNLETALGFKARSGHLASRLNQSQERNHFREAVELQMRGGNGE